MGSRIHMKNLIGRGTNCVLWGRKKEKMSICVFITKHLQGVSVEGKE